MAELHSRLLKYYAVKGFIQKILARLIIIKQQLFIPLKDTYSYGTPSMLQYRIL